MESRGSMKARAKRLDRIAGEINAWLLLLAVGLAVLDATVMMTLHLPTAQMDQSADAAATSR